MKDIFKKYKEKLNNIKREDPLWYLEIEHQLYERIDRSDKLGFNYIELLELDEDIISNTIFKENRIIGFINILIDIGFRCSYEEYDETNECETLTILWDTTHRQNT